jgi:hypothetical protein
VIVGGTVSPAKVCLYNVTRQRRARRVFARAGQERRGRKASLVQVHGSAYHLRNYGVAAVILKLTTNDKASIWVNLSRILQMTQIDAQNGYPNTQIVMDNGAVICVFETPDDIAQWTKIR